MDDDNIDFDKLCKTKFSANINKWVTSDDLLNLLYFITNLSIIVLATINTIKLNNNNISESSQEYINIEYSQKIFRLTAGILAVIIGLYNIFIFRFIHYSVSNRLIVGLFQLIMGIVFVILTTYNISNTIKEEKKIINI